MPITGSGGPQSHAETQLGSVHALERALASQNIRSKARITLDDRSLGGEHFSRGALFHLLRNPIYIGKIVHKTEQYDGAHDAIVDTSLFEAATVSLDTNARRHATTRIQSSKALLGGRIFDADGQPMSPTFGHGARGQVYRYYVTASLQQGQQRPRDDGAIRRVSGPVLEDKLRELMASLISTSTTDELKHLIRVEVHSQSLQLLLPIALHASVAPRLVAPTYAG